MVLTGQDFPMAAGDDVDIQFEINDAQGVDVNLTGGTLDWYMKESADSVTYIIHKNSGTPAQLELTDPTHGICVVHLLAADTQALKGGKYFHGLKLIEQDTTHHYLAEGYITMSPPLI